MKIVITGGLGYIGSELCQLYCGETRKHQITVFDTRFLPERVSQLRKWGFNFVQGSILDIDLVKDTLKDSDLIYHLAGITDVAYVKTEANSEQDQLIRRVAVEGTQNILSSLHPKCRIIFPSTHVVFEGLKDIKLHLLETAQVSPVLAYASSKVTNEEAIKHQSNNYIILRLGSVYGLSTDSMRINIMPNLFSKITALDGEIKLFSGGEQYKSLVYIKDVARCMKFFGDTKTDIKNQTYHLTHENVMVKHVANLCQKINPNVKLTVTNDEAPNKGYTLSNQKLIDTGFVFYGNLERGLREMISHWKYQAPNKFNEKIIKGNNEVIDERGKIVNYELPEPINLIGYIESKAGSIRANHYHPTQEQKCLLISGSFVSVTKDLLNPDAQERTKLILPGDLSVIPPNIAHAMIFTRDSVFLNLVNGERDHDKYGVTHTIPYLLVDKAKALFYLQ